MSQARQLAQHGGDRDRCPGRQCLDRRIDSYTRLVAETAAWEKRRNAEPARINWMFTAEKARTKMGRAYPKPAGKSDKRQRVRTSVQRYQ